MVRAAGFRATVFGYSRCMTIAAVDTGPQPRSLLTPADPPPFSPVNTGGRAPILLLADHAGRAFPETLDRLGLDAPPLDRHITYDIGIADVTRRLAERLDAPAIMHNYSRLLIDPNRPLDDPTSICAVSDGVMVPGNRDLGPLDRAARADAVYWPYHGAIAAAIDGFLALGVAPAVISLHSFTPFLRSLPRPWHIGVLWDQDGRIAVPLMAALARDPALCVGDNQPYSGRNRHGYTVETHAMERGFANVLLELRQDLIDTPATAAAWADRLAEVLAPILADREIYRPRAA